MQEAAVGDQRCASRGIRVIRRPRGHGCGHKHGIVIPRVGTYPCASSSTNHPGDADVPAEPTRHSGTVNALSIDLQAMSLHEAVVTMNEEGDLVLGPGSTTPDVPKVVHH